MSSFDERQKGFEKKFAHDQELQFKVSARRNKYIGQWASKILGYDDEKEKEYIIQKGDTLWEIAQKHKGISISKIKEYNSLDSDNLTPGTRILLPIR